MYYDFIPIPSKGLFYENKLDILKVYFMTTEDELTLTAPNIFNQGAALRLLLEKTVCEPNKLRYNELLLGDKEFLLLYLKETAYGHVIDYQDKDRIYFDTRNVGIKNISQLPDDGEFYTYQHGNDELKIRHLRVSDEPHIKSGQRLSSYIQQVHSVNGNTDRRYIKHYMEYMSILEGRVLKSFIDSIGFGLQKKTFCLINETRTEIELTVDEGLFGLTQENLGKVSKSINDMISFLCNEGNGYTMEGVLKLPVHIRKFHEENLVKKIQKINENMKNNK